MRVLASVVLTTVLLAGCGSTVEEPDEIVATPTEDRTGVAEDLTGTLEGDAALEGGCAWLDTPTGRFEVTYPDGYELAFDPLRLEGPDGVVARAGDPVTVRGHIDDSISTLCQTGRIFTATEVVTGA